MHAPRRVPYRSLGDLGAVHAQVYGPSSSTIGAPPTPSSSSSSSSTPSAVRCPPELALYAHHSPASTPVALSLTASLLSALALPPSLAQRLALSAALVRLVNSLVDPLQQGLYARPIALLAAELGLPGWLVELRHAATHDDLPSLAVLSDGAREALAYLDRAYWQPTLNPPQAVNSDESWAVHAAVLPALLGTYKRLAKQLARDSSTFPGPFKACVAELRTWVAAPQDDQRALGLLVDRLVAGGEGLLVPLAKKCVVRASAPSCFCLPTQAQPAALPCARLTPPPFQPPGNGPSSPLRPRTRPSSSWQRTRPSFSPSQSRTRPSFRRSSPAGSQAPCRPLPGRAQTTPRPAARGPRTAPSRPGSSGRLRPSLTSTRVGRPWATCARRRLRATSSRRSSVSWPAGIRTSWAGGSAAC